MLIGLPENDADLVIGEVFAREDFDLLVSVSLGPTFGVTLLNPRPVGIGDAVAFVAKGFRLLLKLLAGVDEHHAAAMTGGLIVPQQPDIGEDAGVVEELVGQHDDGVEPVVFQNPAADLALAGTAIAIREGRAIEDDRDAAAAFLGRCHLGEHGLQKEQGAVIHARHPGAVAGQFQLARFLLVAVLPAPGDAERRIAQHPVEVPLRLRPLVTRLLAVLIVRDERIAEVDGRLPVVFNEEVGLTDGVVRGGKFLPVNGDVFLHPRLFLRRVGTLQQVLLRHRQHAARAAGGVVDREMLVRDRNIQQLDHQADDFARGKVFPGLVTALFRKAPQQLLVDVAHLQPGELVGAEREFLVLVQDRGQPVILHHQPDGCSIIEMLDDVVNVLRKAIDVGAEIFLEQRMVFLIDRAERPIRLVRERTLLRIQLQFLDQLRQFLLAELGATLEHISGFLLPPRNQDTLQPPDDDDGQDDALILVGLELPAQPLGGFPDVGSEVVELGFVEREGHKDRKSGHPNHGDCHARCVTCLSKSFEEKLTRALPGFTDSGWGQGSERSCRRGSTPRPLRP